jgi:hypothetical protein
VVFFPSHFPEWSIGLKKKKGGKKKKEKLRPLRLHAVSSSPRRY